MAAFSLKNNPLSKYIRSSYQELQKVVWPTKKVIIRDTSIVIGLASAIGLFFALIDFGFSNGLQYLISLR